MCDCIKNINEALKALYGNAGMEQNCTTFDGKVYLSASYRPRTKEGRTYRHNLYLGIYPPFCPFCGKPYEEGSTGTNIHNPYTKNTIQIDTTED